MQTQVPNILPDYHFLVIGPGLGVEWLFDAAAAYFNRFRPTIVTDYNFIRLIPSDMTVAVTILIRRDSAAQFGVQLAQIRPDALYDAVVEETSTDAKRVLDQRAELNQPFGVPLDGQMPTLEEGLLSTIPTPMLPTSSAGDLVTSEPSTPAPAPSPLPTDNPSPPIAPTPGALIGG